MRMRWRVDLVNDDMNLACVVIHVLEAGEIDRRRTRLLRRPMSQAEVERRVFPDAYRARAEADGFRERHASTLRDSGAIHRVRAWLTQTADYVLPVDAVDDWLVTFGLARFLTAPRTGARAE